MFNYSKINNLVDYSQNEKKTLTIQQIADKIGVSKTQFDNYRSGRSMPTVDMLEKIAIYFGKDMNYFFDTMIPIEVQKPDPVIITDANEYIMKRFEELVAENTLLKKKVEEYEISNSASYTLQNVPVTTAAEPKIELKKQTL